MKANIANTDFKWYRFLSEQSCIDEVNFWRPMGGTNFKALAPGNPFIFKLKKAYHNAIVGFGIFAMYKELEMHEAWAAFGAGNGASSFEAMSDSVFTYLRKSKNTEPTRNHRIGCILLASPVFFPESLWIPGPQDWSDSIVANKTYSTLQGEGKRIWEACLHNSNLLTIPSTASHNLTLIKETDRWGKEQFVRPRLGQGTFRYAVLNAYNQCAVTSEHSLPALDAAHIIPFAEGGVHEVSNGLLLRADIHRLYDKGYVTVTPDYKFKVSSLLESEYNNGKIYYALEGRHICTPQNVYDRPDPEKLAYHASEIFRG